MSRSDFFKGRAEYFPVYQNEKQLEASSLRINDSNISTRSRLNRLLRTLTLLLLVGTAVLYLSPISLLHRPRHPSPSLMGNDSDPQWTFVGYHESSCSATPVSPANGTSPANCTGLDQLLSKLHFDGGGAWTLCTWGTGEQQTCDGNLVFNYTDTDCDWAYHVGAYTVINATTQDCLGNLLS